MRSLVAVAICSSILAIAPESSAQEVEIKLGTLAPKGSEWDLQLREMGQKWTEASGGKVKLRVYPGGVLGSEGDMVRKMRVGQITAAALTVVGLHDITPEPQGIGAPFVIESNKELDYVMSKLSTKLDAIMEKKGYVVLSWSEVGWVHFFSTQAFHTVAQAKNAKLFVWDGDPDSVEAWKVGGFHPVVLSASDISPSIATGLIDTVATSPLYALKARMHMKLSHMLDLPWAILTGAIIVKKDVWEKVPADVRPRLMEISRAYGRRLAEDVRNQEQQAIATMKQQGVTVDKAEDLPGWRASAEKANQVVRGKVVPAEFFDEVTRLHREFGALPKK